MKTSELIKILDAQTKNRGDLDIYIAASRDADCYYKAVAVYPDIANNPSHEKGEGKLFEFYVISANDNVDNLKRGALNEG